MYCKKCGKEIKDGVAFCNYCGAPAQHESFSASPAYSQPNVNNYQQPQPIQQSFAPAQTPLEKIAWFAPVAIIIMGIMGSVSNGIYSFGNSLVSGNMIIFITVSTFLSVLFFVLKIVTCVGLFRLALSKANKKFNIVYLPAAFIPFVLFDIPTIIWNIISQVLIRFDSYVILSISNYAYPIIRAAVIALISYFVAVKYFKTVASYKKENN